MRDISDVLKFRQDISPFLVHLTRNRNGQSAKSSLTSILDSKSLRPGSTEISDVRFGGGTDHMASAEKQEFFAAVCFTETPLAEAHCLLDIQNRSCNLAPYGIVLLKDKLAARGVAPVFYINNTMADKDHVFQALYSLISTHPHAATLILPLISVFGKKVKHPNAGARPLGDNDWRWEREWRYPASLGDCTIDPDEVFLGLCPDEDIQYFESRYTTANWGHQLRFIDPMRNLTWYAEKLLQARQRVDLKTSVV